MPRIVIGTAVDPAKQVDEIAQNECVGGTFLVFYEFEVEGRDARLEQTADSLRMALQGLKQAGGPLTRQSWLLISDQQLERVFSTLIEALGLDNHALTVIELPKGEGLSWHPTKRTVSEIYPMTAEYFARHRVT